jgi:hypothetical protein
MSKTYKWNSSKKPEEILESIADQALLQKKTFFPMSLSKDTEFNFKLAYDPVGTSRLRFSYTPSGLKGKIERSSKGCVVTAESWHFKALACNLANIFLVILLYATGAFTFTAGDLPIATALICLALAVGMTWHLLYTYKKYRNLKRHLEIINLATGVDAVAG